MIPNPETLEQLEKLKAKADAAYERLTKAAEAERNARLERQEAQKASDDAAGELSRALHEVYGVHP